MFNFDNSPQLVLRALFRYLIEGIVVMFVAHRLLKGQNFEKFGDLLLIGLTASTVLSLLDAFAPENLSEYVRSGTGIAIGANMVNLK